MGSTEELAKDLAKKWEKGKQREQALHRLILALKVLETAGTDCRKGLAIRRTSSIDEWGRITFKVKTSKELASHRVGIALMIAVGLDITGKDGIYVEPFIDFEGVE
ncbi:MAG: hypothetical protein DRP82_02735 [Planctomycetota bacterium]|nr:MAG: hypothetical protein DRP82_02735 [Planctomycetota bacterium]